MWWLDKGLAGFRIDAIINIKKDLAFPDMEPDGDDGLASCWRMVENVEGVDALLEDLKNHTFAKKDAFTVGEVFNIGVEDLPDFIGENGHFSTIFDFSAHILSDGEHGWYDAPHMFLRLLAAQMGVGGDDSWRSPVHEQYQLPADQPLSLNVQLKLF